MPRRVNGVALGHNCCSALFHTEKWTIYRSSCSQRIWNLVCHCQIWKEDCHESWEQYVEWGELFMTFQLPQRLWHDTEFPGLTLASPIVQLWWAHWEKLTCILKCFCSALLKSKSMNSWLEVQLLKNRLVSQSLLLFALWIGLCSPTPQLLNWCHLHHTHLKQKQRVSQHDWTNSISLHVHRTWR